MKKLAIILSVLSLVFFLGACQQKEQQGPGAKSETKSGSAQQQPAGQPATEQAPAQPAAPGKESAQPPAEQKQSAAEPSTTTGQQTAQQQPSGEMGGHPLSAGSPGSPPPAPGPEAQQPAGQQQGATGQQTAQEGKAGEHMGQSPPFGNAPETITLQAKNGNVTFPHKMHAGMMPCSTCHGEKGPGKIEGFGKDKAHELCRGCHQKRGAGPTNCTDCHKKS